jgi:hypothetical protein
VAIPLAKSIIIKRMAKCQNLPRIGSLETFSEDDINSFYKDSWILSLGFFFILKHIVISLKDDYYVYFMPSGSGEVLLA